MDWVGIIIQLVRRCGWRIWHGRVAKKVSINPTVDAIVGLIGGYVGTWLVGLIPGLAGMVAGGGAAYVGQGVTGLVGGAILTAIVGAIKNAMRALQPSNGLFARPGRRRAARVWFPDFER